MPAVWALQPTCVAFQLGWDMARLYSVVIECKPFDVTPGWKLPSQREFTGRLHALDAERRLASVSAGLYRMDATFKAAGLGRPSASTLLDQYTGGANRVELQASTYRLHVATLISLQAADPRFGSAYNLGRALCDTAIDSSRPLRQRFGYHRVNGLRAELAALAASFPPHSARAVCWSLCLWRCVLGSRLSTKRHDELQGVMPRQAEAWRGLLSGEKRGTDLLATDDYTTAGQRLASRAASVTSEVARSYRTGLLVAAGLFAIGVAIVLVSGGAAGIVAGIGVAASALGVTWKGVAATVTTLGDKLRAPLWEAELDRAIGEAVSLVEGRAAYTSLPPEARRCVQEMRRAGGAGGGGPGSD